MWRFGRSAEKICRLFKFIDRLGHALQPPSLDRLRIIKAATFLAPLTPFEPPMLANSTPEMQQIGPFRAQIRRLHFLLDTCFLSQRGYIMPAR
jgi:hypothetical protein